MAAELTVCLFCFLVSLIIISITHHQVRRLIEEELPYEEFVSKLLAAKLIAPCYLTVVGTEKAVVVTRGKMVAEDVR